MAEDTIAVSLLSSESTEAEIYIAEMLDSGKGLAPWDPRPRKPYLDERGIVPGDVGTFSVSDGFKRIFNIFEDGKSIKAANSDWETYHPPEVKVVTHEEELSLGHTIVRGASVDVKFTADDM